MVLGKFFPFISLLLLSCSVNQKIGLIKPRPSHTALPYDEIYKCSAKKKKEIYLGNSEHYSYFQEMINRLKKDNISLKSVEKFVLWGLTQSLLRPDQVSLDSHTVIIVNYKKSTKFFQTKKQSKKQEQYGFIESLKFLLKRYQAKRSLNELLELFDEYYPIYITAGKDLSEFLSREKSKLESQRESYTLFFRGEDQLLFNELYRRPLLSKVFKKLSGSKKEPLKITPVKLNRLSNKFWKCNFDFTPYISGKLQKNITGNDSFLFGYKNNHFSIIMNTQTKIDWTSNPKYKNIFPNANLVNKTPLCYYNDGKTQLVLNSHQGKDPAQTLSHLYRYGVENLQDATQVYRLTNFARHLVLRNPTRILYESHRGTKDQLAKLNSLNIPIYHAKQIGEISGLLQIKNAPGNFLLDDRSSIRENCQQ